MPVLRRILPTALLAGVALVAALAASTSVADTTLELPELGNATAAIVSPAEERTLGEKIIRAVRQELPVASDPPLKYYNEQLLGELAAASELSDHDLHIVVVHSPVLNAFAAPGNVVAVNMGLFLQAQNVHEFSAVLAHELAHLSQRHFARGVEYQRKAALPYVAALLASIAVMATVGGDAGLAALSTTQAAAQDSSLRYSRSREQEADRIGIDTLERAGLDPYAMAAMFGRLADANRYEQRPPEFLLTHPVTESRIADARNQASQLPRHAHLDRDDYQFARCRARVYLAASADAALRQARELQRAQPDAPASTYCMALALDRAKDFDAAIALLPTLEAAEPDNFYVQMLRPELLVDAGRAAEALPYTERGLRLTPDNMPFALYHAQALSKLGRHAEAARVLQRQTQLRPGDADIWYELAEESGLAGDTRGVHVARAEYFQLIGRFDDALKQLEYARRLTTSDPRQRARIDQRTADVRALKERIDRG